MRFVRPSGYNDSMNNKTYTYHTPAADVRLGWFVNRGGKPCKVIARTVRADGSVLLSFQGAAPVDVPGDLNLPVISDN